MHETLEDVREQLLQGLLERITARQYGSVELAHLETSSANVLQFRAARQVSY
jgi:hypothetical protein